MYQNVYDTRIIIFCYERALKIRRTVVNCFEYISSSSILIIIQRNLKQKGCDIITGYEKRVSGEMSLDRAQ